MQKFLLALTLVTLSLTASAQRRGPRLPIPPVNVGFRCEVVMVDGWQRVLRSYTGRRDVISGNCRTPMMNCRQDMRMRRNGRYLRCVEARNGRWN